ncbi:ladder protein [Loa loa]|uniref:Ladder protein n=2 Tax=Loa loa TaxID=7209 RepID=A0A1S0UK21_LOALO|nr:ladder protein [Loa loa]EJD75821.1 ladder protein [Loa loa]
MLITSVIWTIVVFTFVVARPESYENVFDIQEANVVQEKMGISRTTRHLQMKSENAETIGKVGDDALMREKGGFELHDWLSHAQKEEIRTMESGGIPKSKIVNRILEFFSKLPSEKIDVWNKVYREQCIKWVETVATNSEIAELEALRSKNDIEEYETKLNEYKSRLPEKERNQINQWKDGCNKLNNLDIKRSTRHIALRQALSQNSGNVHLLSNEQIALLEGMKASDANEEDIKHRVKQYYLAFPEYKRKKLDYQIRTKCVQWVQDVTNFHEIQLLLNLFERRNRLVFNTLLDEYFERLPKEEQDKLHYIKDICREMWKKAMISSRRKRYIDEEYNEWILWMNDEPKHELQQMRNDEPLFDAKHKKEKCKEYFAALARKDEIKKLEVMRDEMNYDEHKKIIDGILNRQPQGVRDRANKFYQICDEVYHKQLGRSKRDIDALMEKHLQWLTPEQKAEIKQMKANGEPLSAIKQKLLSYIGIMETDKQFHIIEKTKQSCYAWLGNVTSVEERVELEKLHHSDHSACKRKVREYIKRLPPGEQEAVNKDLEVCEHIWYNEGRHESGHEHHHHHQQHRGARCLPQKIHAVAHGRSKRDHHEHNLDEYFRTHLSWLTDIQKDEIRKMKEEGKPKADMQKKIFDYYESLTGDEKKEASEKLREGCRALLKQIVGDEKMAELKQMKDSGVGIEELIAKVDHMLEHVTDEPKRKKFRNMKDEIRKMKEEGKPKADMQKKIFDYYESLTGDEKKEASEKLREGCRALLKQIVGDEKMAELKQMKDSGVGIEELIAKVDHMLEHVTDEPKKEKIQEYGPACRKIYGDRHKRDHHEHNLDEYFRTHLSWLTDIQKDEIRKMKEEGKPKADMQKKIFDYYESLTGDEKKEASEKLREGCRALLKQIVGDEKMAELKQMKDSGVGIEELIAKVDHMLEHKDEIRKMKEEGKPKADMQKKIFDYYESLTGDEKKEASEKLREGCRALLKQIVGDEKMAELKQMKDSGVGIEELIAKVDHMLEHVTDEPKKEKIQEYGPACHKIYGTPVMRNKRNQANNGTKHCSSPYLQWLTDEEKGEIRKIIGGNKSRADILKAIFFYYQILPGKEKKNAGERLRLSCEEIVRSLVYENRLSELEALENDSSTMSEMMKMLSAATDRSKFAQIKAYQTACNRIFDLRQLVRRKREHKGNSIDNYLEKNLKWLSVEQREELREMKKNGKSRADMIAKMFHYYEELFGEAKQHVTERLYDGCRQILKDVVGGDRYNELAKMKDSGANMNDLKAKADAMMGHKHSLEEHFKTDLKWLTKEQKDELLKMKEENKSEADIREKVLHFYESLNEEAKKETAEFLNGPCNDMIAHVFGDEKATELKELRKSVGIADEIRRKMDAMIDEVKDEDRRAKAREYGSICQKIFVDYQHKHNEHSLAHYFRTHLKWLPEAQKEEIKKMSADGKSREEIQSKIFEFFERASGETKKYATESLLEGCYELFKMIGGEEKADELHVMIQSDLTAEKIEEKIISIIDSVDDQSKKAYAKAYVTPCMQLYSIRLSRQKRGSRLLDACLLIKNMVGYLEALLDLSQ